MTSVEEIRQRDRNAIPRLGDPDNDPLLRAEMDRRFLLAELESMKAYGADLIRQRAEHDIARTEAEVRVARLESDVRGQEQTIRTRDEEIYREKARADAFGAKLRKIIDEIDVLADHWENTNKKINLRDAAQRIRKIVK